MTGKTQVERLSDLRVAELAASVPDWSLGEGMISRQFDFADFVESMAFVNRVAALAEERDHHPDIEISYNHVRIDLSTHRVGGLTEKDFELAQAVDGLI
ncbi:MAG: 4a-hydroxytetrahydrobiopterin dehydratase [Gaiellaceae bacterium]|jgi:4a-hydroxytetrahydrobiopterin dehydratase